MTRDGCLGTDRLVEIFITSLGQITYIIPFSLLQLASISQLSPLTVFDCQHNPEPSPIVADGAALPPLGGNYYQRANIVPEGIIRGGRGVCVWKEGRIVPQYCPTTIPSGH